MDAPSAVDADAHQHDARLVHRHADGVRRAVARVPAPALACFGKTVRRRFHRVERVQPIDLIGKGHNKPNIPELLHNHIYGWKCSRNVVSYELLGLKVARWTT